MVGTLGAGEIILIIFITFLPVILWVVALVDIMKNDFQGNNKIAWVLVVIFLPIIGAALYFIMGKSQKTAV